MWDFLAGANWTAVAAVVAPFLALATWFASKKERTKASDADVMKSTAEAAASTVATMRSLLIPLEDEIRELRTEVVSLRRHVVLLEAQVRELGAQPVPSPTQRGTTT